jgi:hypothetical protein
MVIRGGPPGEPALGLGGGGAPGGQPGGGGGGCFSGIGHICIETANQA